MYSSGEVYANVVEMILQAFQANKMQYAIELGDYKKLCVVRETQHFGE